MKSAPVYLNFILVFFISTLSYAQNPHWDWVLQGGGSKTDEGEWIHCEPDFVYISGQFYKTTTIGDTTLDGEESWAAMLAACTKDGQWDYAMSMGPKKENFQIMETTLDNKYMYGASRFDGQVEAETEILTSRGNYDFYIMKKDFGGENALWYLQAGGTERDEVLGLSVDNEDNCYITGRFQGTAEFGPFSLTSKEDNDIYVAKISKDGEWLWATSAGGKAHDGGNGIAVDRMGNVYICGSFQLDATFGNTSLTATGSGGYSDMFIAKLDPYGNWLWAKKSGGDYTVSTKDIATDKYGNLFITGTFEGNANIAGTSFQSKGSSDIFVAKANSDGVWQWAISAGGSSYDVAQGIDVDTDVAIYITGYFKGVSNFGAHYVNVDVERDLFVAKIVE